MRVNIRLDDAALSEEARQHIGECVVKALAPFAGRLRSVMVQADGVGEEAARCHLLLELDPAGGLAIDEAGPCPLSSVERAMAAARTALRQEFARRQARGLGGGFGLICA